MKLLLVLLHLLLSSCSKIDKEEKGNQLVTPLLKALAAIAGGEVDKLFETKGLDYLDRERLRDQAINNAQRGYDDHYGQHEEWSPEHRPPLTTKDIK